MGGTQIRMTRCDGTLVELAGGREAGRRAGRRTGRRTGSSLTAESGAPGVKFLMKGGGRGAVRKRGGGLGSNKWPTPEREGLQKGKSIYSIEHSTIRNDTLLHKWIPEPPALTAHQIPNQGALNSVR